MWLVSHARNSVFSNQARARQIGMPPTWNGWQTGERVETRLSRNNPEAVNSGQCRGHTCFRHIAHTIMSVLDKLQKVL